MGTIKRHFEFSSLDAAENIKKGDFLYRTSADSEYDYCAVESLYIDTYYVREIEASVRHDLVYVNEHDGRQYWTYEVIRPISKTKIK